MGTDARITKDSEFLAMHADRFDEIRTRLADLIEEDPVSLAIDLVGLSLPLFAQAHPAELTSEEKQRIRHFTPSMTDALIDERAMDKDGVLLTLATCLDTCRNALQCFPESDCRSIVSEHEQFTFFIENSLVPSIEGTFDGAVSAGMHPLSVATMLILGGTVQAAKQGVHWSLLLAPLLTAIEHVIAPALKEMDKKDTGSLIRVVMEERGVSEAEARRFVMRMMKASPY